MCFLELFVEVELVLGITGQEHKVGESKTGSAYIWPLHEINARDRVVN